MKKILLSLLIIPAVALAIRFTTKQIVIDGDMSTSVVNSTAMDMNQLTISSIQAVFTGSPVGTLKVQVSNSMVVDCTDSTVVWTDYTGSSQAISAAGNFAYNLSEYGYRCVRLVYTRTSGTGVLNAYFVGKGP